jgi:hypothetical protein
VAFSHRRGGKDMCVHAISDAEVVGLRDRAEKATLMRRPELFQIVLLQAGAKSLRDAIIAALHP